MTRHNAKSESMSRIFREIRHLQVEQLKSIRHLADVCPTTAKSTFALSNDALRSIQSLSPEDLKNLEESHNLMSLFSFATSDINLAKIASNLSNPLTLHLAEDYAN